MKILKYILPVFLIASILHAQITMVADDISAHLAVGQKVTTFANFSVTTANIGLPGATSWDFSGLASEAEFVTESKDKTSSPYAADFPDAQFASYYEGTFQGTFSKTWVYTSFGSGAYEIDGTGTVATVSGMDQTARIFYSPKKQQYIFPLTYNSSWSYTGKQTLKTTIVIPIIGGQTTTLDQDLTSNYTVDGYGSITMPDGKVLEALRVKETSTLTTSGQSPVTAVTYHILTKTGESMSITVSDNSSTSGTVGISAISWTDGKGVSGGGGNQKVVNAPTLLKADASNGKIDLSWIDNADNEDGYTIERAEANGLFTVIGQTTANTNSYSDVNIQNGVAYHYKIQAYSGTDVSDYSNVADVTGIVTDVKATSNGISSDYKLEQNYPNPFNPSTKISFTVPERSVVSLKVFNILGEEVALIVQHEFQPGNYEFEWNAESLPSGIYFCSLKTAGFSTVRKMLLLK